MRKYLRVLLLSAVFTVLLRGSALAADTGSGMYDVTGGLKPMAAGDDAQITATQKDIDGTTKDFFANAERVQLDYSTKVNSGDQCLVFVLDDGSKTPNANNIVYIDQVEASGSSVTFKIYPKSLVKGKTYSVYVSTSNEASTGLAEAGTFKYNMDYKLGDINADTKINSDDALFALRMAVGLRKEDKNTLVAWTDTERLAADVNKNGSVTSDDVLFILEKAVGLPSKYL